MRTNRWQKAPLRRGFLFILLAVLIAFSSGCASDRNAHADAIANEAGFHRAQVKTDMFLLTIYSRITDPTQPFDVYIEGDGLAWLSLSEPSRNPTPRKALGLSLAALDPTANVIYIARPCQFTPLDRDPNCRVSYWTDRRFSEDVIASVNQAVDQLTASAKIRKLNLIGYSGGGAVAILVAARRDDVASIRTVAGNLDHAEVNRQHDVTPMAGSLNAIDQARKVASIPQIHFSGQDDDVIRPAIAQRFRAASEPTNCITLRVIDSVTHEDGWRNRWPSLLNDVPTCEAKLGG